MKIKVTEAAAGQIRAAAKQSGTEGMALRVAAKRQQDGSIEYAMGFDDEQDTDSQVDALGVSIVVAPTSIALVDGMTVDFVELQSGQSEFIFLNPNDPHYIPPTE